MENQVLKPVNVAILEAIKISGSQRELGRRCGVSQGAVHKWLYELSRISPGRAIQLERAVEGEISRANFCPQFEWD